MKLIQMAERTIAAAFVVALFSASSMTSGASEAQTGLTVPITFDDGGRPSVDVVMDGKHEFTFALDTAAQRTTIGAPVIEALDLVADPDNVAMAHGSAGVGELPMYRIGQVESLGQTMTDGLYMAAADIRHDDGFSHQGILGQEFFADGTLRLDFKQREVGLDEGTPPKGASEGLPIELMYGGFVLAPVSINGIDATAVIDTGASTSFANAALMTELGVEVGEDGIVEDQRIGGVTQDSIGVIKGFKGQYVIAGSTIDDAPLEFTESRIFNSFQLADRPAVILGMDVLAHLPGIFIDYENATLQVLR